MKRVLVTGATGFIGSACLPRLAARGYEVHAISSRPHASSGDIRWHQCNLLDHGGAAKVVAAVQPSHLLHLAWIATPGVFWNSSLNLDWLASGVTLVEAFFREGGTRALGAGTCAEYAWVNGPYSEDTTPLEPATIYGRCKRALGLGFEAGALAYGGSAAWARLFFPYGPGEADARVIPSVIRALLQGKPIECTDGKQYRDFIFVDDVAEALVLLLDSSATGPFNVGSAQGTTVREAISIIVSQLGHGELVRLGSRQPPEGDPASVVSDNAKLRQATGWQTRTDLRSGIARTIDYWRNRGTSTRINE